MARSPRYWSTAARMAARRATMRPRSLRRRRSKLGCGRQAAVGATKALILGRTARGSSPPPGQNASPSTEHEGNHSQAQSQDRAADRARGVGRVALVRAVRAASRNVARRDGRSDAPGCFPGRRSRSVRRRSLVGPSTRSRRTPPAEVTMLNGACSSTGTRPRIGVDASLSTRPQPEPYQGGNRGPRRTTGDAVSRRDKDGGKTRPERVFMF
jgi:hypothetical protein